MASVFRFCASRAVEARDSAPIVIQARSGTASTSPSPEVMTTGSCGDPAGCCAKDNDAAHNARAGTRRDKDAILRWVTIGLPGKTQSGSTDSDAKPADQVGCRYHEAHAVWSARSAGTP